MKCEKSKQAHQKKEYEFCDTSTGKVAKITQPMAVAFVKKALGPCSSAAQERALLQLNSGFCFSVDGGIVRKAETKREARIKAVKEIANNTLYPITVKVSRKEFIKLPMAVRRRAMREQAERIAAAGFQALMDEGDDE
jgi:hypothetical protein